MDASPDAEDLAVKLISDYSEHLRSESERIAGLARADRVSSAFVDQAATNLGLKHQVVRLPGLATSFGYIMAGLALGVGFGVLVADTSGRTVALVVATGIGVVGLGLAAVGAAQAARSRW